MQRSVWARFDEIFVITCAKYKERMDYLSAELERVGISKYHLIIDIESPIKEIVRKHVRTSSFLQQKGPFACYLGHYRAIKTAYELGARSCLIMEDDVAFLKDKDTIEAEVEALPDDFDFAQFSHVKPMPMKDEDYVLSLYAVPQNRYWKRFTRLRDNGCYALSRKAMKTLIEYMEAAIRGTTELSANDLLVDKCNDLNKYAVYPNMAVQNLFPNRNSSDKTYWDRLQRLDGVSLGDYNLALQKGRIFVFTNVYKFVNDSEFNRAIRMLELTEADTVIFLNKCVPLMHVVDLGLLSRPTIITMHRIHYLKDGTVEWFGESDIIDLKSTSSSFKPKIFRMFNDGLIVNSENEEEKYKIPFGEEYPTDKYPTTGYLALQYAIKELKGDVVPVNFYGEDDNSTGKYFKHDWVYEDRYVKALPNRTFLEPIESSASGKRNVPSGGNGYRIGGNRVYRFSQTGTSTLKEYKIGDPAFRNRGKNTDFFG